MSLICVIQTAKRSSLQELPRTARNIQRENNLMTMTSEIQKMKTYKLQKKNLIETGKHDLLSTIYKL